MSYRQIDEVLQWVGALFIIAGHVLNAMDGWNILAFTLGTIAFLLWTIRVRNKPQFVVNAVAITTCLIGLYRAFG
jgi:hypothetical protein